MANYKYIDRKDADRVVPLDEIEAVGARAVGNEPGDSRPHESVATTIGFAILMREGGSTLAGWEPGKGGSMLKPTCPDEDRERINKICDAVFGSYTIMAWRGP